ncbi:MAG: FAD-dependent oxidoreductase [Pseudomonadota bacterium]
MPILFPSRFDTVIIGARCAGAATALHLARGGQRVLVVDRDRPGTDTLSTHALMRLGVSLLDEAGVLPALQRAGTPAVRRTVFTYGGARLPVDVSPRGRAEGLYAPRRYVLDSVLADAADAAGATFAYQTALHGLTRGADGRVTGVELRLPDGSLQSVACGTVIGADGRQSAVAEAVNARVLRRSRHQTASIYTYVAAQGLQGYEWLYGSGIMAGLIPTNGGQACAFASMPEDALRRLGGQDAYRALREVFDRCGAPEDFLPDVPAERIRRFAGARGHIRQAWGAGWALVGDAGYFKDPATAHGITDALRDAKLLSEALLSGGTAALGGYQETRDALSTEFFEVTDKIAALDWSLDEVQHLHRELHRLMRIEQEALLGTPRQHAA